MMRILSGTACLFLSVVSSELLAEPPVATADESEADASNQRRELPDRPVVVPDYPPIPEEPEADDRLERTMEAAKDADEQTEIICLDDGCMIFDQGIFVIPPEAPAE